MLFSRGSSQSRDQANSLPFLSHQGSPFIPINGLTKGREAGEREGVGKEGRKKERKERRKEGREAGHRSLHHQGQDQRTRQPMALFCGNTGMKLAERTP